ncbi:MAG: energy transducer TonB [Chthoniobacterales bacterium]|nr:energy transducer TonB [Chthoniobacterales bacterium]
MVPRHVLHCTGLTLLNACASTPIRSPATPPAEYASYQAPTACGDSSATRTAPLPRNYDDVARQVAVAWPDKFPRGSRRTAFLWYFIRENGSVAETRLWRSSGSRDIDEIAVDAGREMVWRPATCGGQPVALWYGHPIALGTSR